MFDIGTFDKLTFDQSEEAALSITITTIPLWQLVSNSSSVWQSIQLPEDED